MLVFGYMTYISYSVQALSPVSILAAIKFNILMENHKKEKKKKKRNKKLNILRRLFCNQMALSFIVRANFRKCRLYHVTLL